MVLVDTFGKPLSFIQVRLTGFTPKQIHIRGIGNCAGDCLVAISTSGSSANVLNAAQTARTRGTKVVALTGKPGSKLEALADICVCTPGGRYADRAQELHIKVIHILIELIERGMFGKS